VDSEPAERSRRHRLHAEFRDVEQADHLGQQRRIGRFFAVAGEREQRAVAHAARRIPERLQNLPGDEVAGRAVQHLDPVPFAHRLRQQIRLVDRADRILRQQRAHHVAGRRRSVLMKLSQQQDAAEITDR